MQPLRSWLCYRQNGSVRIRIHEKKGNYFINFGIQDTGAVLHIKFDLLHLTCHRLLPGAYSANECGSVFAGDVVTYPTSLSRVYAERRSPVSNGTFLSVPDARRGIDVDLELGIKYDIPRKDERRVECSGEDDAVFEVMQSGLEKSETKSVNGDLQTEKNSARSTYSESFRRYATNTKVRAFRWRGRHLQLRRLGHGGSAFPNVRCKWRPNGRQKDAEADYGGSPYPHQLSPSTKFVQR